MARFGRGIAVVHVEVLRGVVHAGGIPCSNSVCFLSGGRFVDAFIVGLSYGSRIVVVRAAVFLVHVVVAVHGGRFVGAGEIALAVHDWV